MRMGGGFPVDLDLLGHPPRVRRLVGPVLRLGGVQLSAGHDVPLVPVLLPPASAGRLPGHQVGGGHRESPLGTPDHLTNLLPNLLPMEKGSPATRRPSS